VHKSHCQKFQRDVRSFPICRGHKNRGKNIFSWLTV
jgi:hypothetical protein